ncbi:MAG: type IV pili methyl-accepting chemotaxis transducer N-terminal domain-containing protein [Akkermansiaceae bacterium]
MVSSNYNKTTTDQPNGVHTNRYKKIIVGIGIFLLVMAFVVISTFVISTSIKKVSSGINLAGRQRMLSQRTAKLVGLMGISYAKSDQQSMHEVRRELALTYNLFDKTLNAFANGGETIGADGKTAVSLEQITDPDLRKSVDEALEVWAKFGPAVQALAEGEASALTKKDLDIVTDMSVQYNLVLLKLMNNLTQGLEEQANKKADALKTIQGGALVVVLINFVWVVVSALGSLRRSDGVVALNTQQMKISNQNLAKTNNELAKSQEELNTSNAELNKAYLTLKEYSEVAEARADELEVLSRDLSRLTEESDTIFNSVDHGLCLIDENFVIGKRVSSTMHDIFETDHLVDRSLVDLLRPLITEKDIRTLENYLKLQFNSKTSKKQLLKYNPLKKIEITLNWDGKSFGNKHLGFNFERILDKEQIVAVLVTVTNITETIILENQLKQVSEDQERNTSLITEILTVDRQELDIFLGQTDKSLDDINDLLQNNGITSEDDPKDLDDKGLIEAIFRKVHNIKGNASMLNLRSIVETTQLVETKLAELRLRDSVSGDEFLGALVELAYLRELLTSYDELNQSLFKGVERTTSSKSATPVTRSEKVVQELQQFTDQLGHDLNKKAFLKAALPMNDLSEELISLNKNIFIQLIRNSMAHGIEDPAVRKKAGKWDTGSIYLSYHLNSTANNAFGEPCHMFSYRDDGKGIDVKAIAETLIAKEILTTEALSSLSEREIVSQIFKSGFSTAESVDEHSGHGVGMNVIYDQIVKQLGGKMRMSYKKGAHTEFTWFVPLARVLS